MPIDKIVIMKEWAIIAKHLLLEHNCFNCEYSLKYNNKNRCCRDMIKYSPESSSSSLLEELPVNEICVHWGCKDENKHIS